MTDGGEEQDLLSFFYACPIGLVEIDATGSICLINPHAMKHMLPLARGGSMTNLFDAFEGTAPDLRTLLCEFEPNSGTVVENYRIAVDLGEGRRGGPVVLACTMVKVATNRVIVTLTDVSQQVVQERRLQQAETWFSTLIDNVNDYAVLTLTTDGRIETVNPSFTRQTGLSCAAAVGLSLDAILTSDPASGSRSFREQLRIAERDGWYLDESWQERQDGSRYWCQRLFAASATHEGAWLTGYSVVLRDVPRRAGDTSQLRQLLTRDHLTGAANRSHFRSVLEREQSNWRKHGVPVGLILLDLDHFKAVNDARGHPVGDQLLRAITKTCIEHLRADDLFARVGGEEFAVLLPNVGLRESAAVAEKLRAAIAETVLDLKDGPLRATASFGCAILSETHGSVDELIALADHRLYAAKGKGRNRVFAGEQVQIAA